MEKIKINIYHKKLTEMFYSFFFFSLFYLREMKRERTVNYNIRTHNILIYYNRQRMAIGYWLKIIYIKSTIHTIYLTT